ncbi:acid protease [Stipitochalara longipes BDJ]|nr:acid protease [Stipitochalara longipes BDJ]
MKSSTILTCVCVLACGSDAAFNLVKPRGPSPIEYGLKRSETPRLRKRDTVGMDLGTRFDGFQYIMNLTMGTPPQTITAAFDTGSSDLCVNAAANDFCTSADPSPCLGAYNVNSSSTSKQVGEVPFLNSYETSQYKGNWYTDTISFAGKTVKDFVFGAADIASNGTENWFGVSFAIPAIARQGSAPPTNDSSLGQMVKAGIVPSSAFSIWMDRDTSRGGSVLLGGVDTSKFVGELQTYPVVPYPGTELYFQLNINMSSASVGGSNPITGNSNASEFPASVLVDTGNPNLLLPTSLVTNIYSTYNIGTLTLANGAKFGICNCSLGSSTATLDIGFTNLKISIPFSDLVISPTAELYAGFNIPASEQIVNGSCMFLVSPSSPIFGNILGDNFLRYAYVVVDLDSKQVGLAESNPTPGASNIMEIAAGSSTLPSVSATGTVATPTGTGSPSGTGSGSSSTSTKSSDGTQLSVASFGVVAGLMGFSYLLL